MFDLVPQPDVVTGPLQMRHHRAQVRAGASDAAVAPVQDRDAHRQARLVTTTTLSLNSRPRSRPKLRDCQVTEVHLGTAP